MKLNGFSNQIRIKFSDDHPSLKRALSYIMSNPRAARFYIRKIIKAHELNPLYDPSLYIYYKFPQFSIRVSFMMPLKNPTIDCIETALNIAGSNIIAYAMFLDENYDNIEALRERFLLFHDLSHVVWLFDDALIQIWTLEVDYDRLVFVAPALHYVEHVLSVLPLVSTIDIKEGKILEIRDHCGYLHRDRIKIVELFLHHINFPAIRTYTEEEYIDILLYAKQHRDVVYVPVGLTTIKNRDFREKLSECGIEYTIEGGVLIVDEERKKFEKNIDAIKELPIQIWTHNGDFKATGFSDIGLYRRISKSLYEPIDKL